MRLITKRVAATLFALSLALSAVTSCSSKTSDSTPTTVSAPVDGSSTGAGSSTTGAAPGTTVGPPPVTAAQVLAAVQAAQTLDDVPSDLRSSLAKPDEAGARTYFDCHSVTNPSNANPFGQCAYGDPHGAKLMVIYGDSRAAMWAAAMEGVAQRMGWKLRLFVLGGCPSPDLKFMSLQTKTPNTNCDLYHSTAVAAIRALHPALVLVTSISDQQLSSGAAPTSEQWQQGWTRTLAQLAQPGTRFAFLGNIPVWSTDSATCLAAHIGSLQKCSVPAAQATPANLDAERAAAATAHAPYINTVPFVCGARCEPVIAGIRVFNNQYHFTSKYATYLSGAMQQAVGPIVKRA